MTDEMIFAAALEKADSAARAAYLNEVCAGDTERRRRLEALLAAHAQAASFLERPAVGLPDPNSADTCTVGHESSESANRCNANIEPHTLWYSSRPIRPSRITVNPEARAMSMMSISFAPLRVPHLQYREQTPFISQVDANRGGRQMHKARALARCKLDCEVTCPIDRPPAP